MTPQQEQVLDDLVSTGDWTKAQGITDRTGVKGPREIVRQLRGMGHNIWSHRAGPNSRGYKYIAGPDHRIAA